MAQKSKIWERKIAGRRIQHIMEQKKETQQRMEQKGRLSKGWKRKGDLAKNGKERDIQERMEERKFNKK